MAGKMHGRGHEQRTAYEAKELQAKCSKYGLKNVKPSGFGLKKVKPKPDEHEIVLKA